MLRIHRLEANADPLGESELVGNGGDLLRLPSGRLEPRRPRTGAEIQGAEVLGTKLRSPGGVDVEPGTDWHSHLGVAKFQHGFAPTSSRVAGNG